MFCWDKALKVVSYSLVLEMKRTSGWREKWRARTLGTDWITLLRLLFLLMHVCFIETPTDKLIKKHISWQFWFVAHWQNLSSLLSSSFQPLLLICAPLSVHLHFLRIYLHTLHRPRACNAAVTWTRSHQPCKRMMSSKPCWISPWSK